MKFVRFQAGDSTGFGILLDGETIRVCAGDMFKRPYATGETLRLDAVRLLPPAQPGAMIALWNNSRPQIAELKRATPEEALYFLKPRSCLATHGDEIVYPRSGSQRVVLEGELGIVIGRPCQGVSADRAKEVIFGYTVINDLTAQDVVKRDASFPQFSRAKGFPGFGVFGPAIETELDPLTLTVESFINGRQCQNYPVTDLVFDPYRIVASVSQTQALEAGDVIACGTSLGADPIAIGDTVEIRIKGIGSLVNKVV